MTNFVMIQQKALIYLDHAATTPMHPEVAVAMQPYYSDKFYNPSANYHVATLIQADLDAARTKIAYWLGARTADIVFTAGATEANNLAIHGVMRQFKGHNMIASKIEHDSVLGPAKHYETRQAPVTRQGIVDVNKLNKLIDAKTVLVSVMYANHEVGTIQPVAKIANLIHSVRSERLKAGNKLPLYMHTDAAQAAGFLDLHIARLGVDLMTINGSKIYGPKQIGALYIHSGLQLLPLLDGGGQEKGLRSGTENVAACVGLAKALDLVQANRLDEVRRLTGLQNQFMELLKQQLPTAIVNGSLKNRLPNNIHVTFPGQDSERLLMQLEENGILAAAGSACAASNDRPSHVLLAMGISELRAQASLRFTMGRSTSSEDIIYTVTTLANLLA